MTTKDQAIAQATLELKLASATGYKCETTYKAVTPEQWGNVVRVLEGIAQPPAPDCRTCDRAFDAESGLTRCGYCTNGNQYIEAPKVVLWRTE